MLGYLYLETSATPPHSRATSRGPSAVHDGRQKAPLPPRNLNMIAVDKAALGSAERDRLALRHERRSESSVKVVARFRPPSQTEAMDEKCTRAFNILPDEQTVESVGRAHTFQFDFVFGEACSQESVYDVVGRPVIDDVLDGYNGTIFAYGQTSSGKTHSMFGPSRTEAKLHSSICGVEGADARGIVPRAASHVFDRLREGADDVEVVLRCSLFEVYREQLRDLTDPTNINLRVKETPQQGIFVDGLTHEFVTCEGDILDLLRHGQRFRVVAATRLNQHSSRSHVIFGLTCEQRLPDGTEKVGKLNLVDLAGSEKVWKSGTHGVTLDEAKKINWSLSALGNVIHALAEKRGHVPYRDSKLTRILQDTLGGNCKTSLLTTCAPVEQHFEETVSSLSFAYRARAICNRVKRNFVYSAERLVSFVERLQHQVLLTRREVARLSGDGMGAPAVEPSRGLRWEPTLLELESGPATDAEAMAQRRRLAAAEEAKAQLETALQGREELISELAAWRRGLDPGVPKVSEWGLLQLQVQALRRALRAQELAGELAMHNRRERGLEEQVAQVKRYADDIGDRSRRALEEVQSLLDSPPCVENTPSPSAPSSPKLGRRDTNDAARSDGLAAAFLRVQPERGMGGSVADRSRQRPSSPASSLLESSATTTGASEIIEADVKPAQRQPETALQAKLEHKLEMMKLDHEREVAMAALRREQQEATFQQWIDSTMITFNALVHSNQDGSSTEHRLQDLLARRRLELASASERLRSERTKLLVKEQELRLKELALQAARVQAEAREPPVPAWMRSACEQAGNALDSLAKQLPRQALGGG